MQHIFLICNAQEQGDLDCELRFKIKPTLVWHITERHVYCLILISHHKILYLILFFKVLKEN